MLRWNHDRFWKEEHLWSPSVNEERQKLLEPRKEKKTTKTIDSHSHLVIVLAGVSIQHLLTLCSGPFCHFLNGNNVATSCINSWCYVCSLSRVNKMRRNCFRRKWSSSTLLIMVINKQNLFHFIAFKTVKSDIVNHLESWFQFLFAVSMCSSTHRWWHICNLIHYTNYHYSQISM